MKYGDDRKGTAVFTDGVHLVCLWDDILHEFAKTIGLKRSWFQNKDKLSHYDLTTKRMTNKAIKAGAILVSKKEIIAICKQKYGGRMDKKSCYDCKYFPCMLKMPCDLASIGACDRWHGKDE